MFEEIGAIGDLHTMYINIAYSYIGQKNPEEALKYGKKAEVDCIEYVDSIGLIHVHNIFGMTANLGKDTTKAFEELHKSIVLAQLTGEKEMIASNYIDIARIRIEHGQHIESVEILMRAIHISKQGSFNDLLVDAYELLHEILAKKGIATDPEWNKMHNEATDWLDAQHNSVNKVQLKEISRLKLELADAQKSSQMWMWLLFASLGLVTILVIRMFK